MGGSPLAVKLHVYELFVWYSSFTEAATIMKFVHIDAHTHVQFPAYDIDRGEVIARAKEAGIAMVNVGADRESSEAAVRVAHEQGEGVFATVGLHPTEAEAQSAFDYEIYKTLALDNKVIAIGECGLDYFHIEGNIGGAKLQQKEIFLKHIELAREVGKPLMIHCRNAMSDLIEFLHDNKAKLNTLPGIMHFFTGTASEAESLVKLGFYFTFGGVITFSNDYNSAIARVPLDRILSETDAPYVAPVPHRGKRNEPFFVLEVEKRLAELRGISTEAMAAQILENARRVFGIMRA